MPAVTTYSGQSTTVDAVLDAFANLLQKAVGFADRLVVEWYGDTRPSLDAAGSHLIWFRWLSEAPDTESGAGRWGTKTELTMEVMLTTRLFEDGGMRDKRLGRQHLACRFNLVNAIYNRWLFDAYRDRVIVAGLTDEPPQPVLVPRAGKVSLGTMVQAQLPKPDRPRPEQGYIESRLGVTVPVVLMVSLNDVLKAPPG